MTEKNPKRRETDKKLVKFDMTINLPLIVTLLLGFITLVTAVVRGYYQHEDRITRLEAVQDSKGELLLEKINQLDRGLSEQKQNTATRLERIEDKLDRIGEGRK